MPGWRGALATAARLVRVYGAQDAAGMLVRKAALRLSRRKPARTPDANREVWDAHDWSRGGEEWTPSPEWMAAILDEVLVPYVPAGCRALEIGPGAGRWTHRLLDRCASLVLVDVSPVCIAICRERFGDDGRIAYHVNDGSSLSFLADGSVDAVWSFDAFVHIAPPEIAAYVGQFPRVLAPGGTAAIHHSAEGEMRKGWRSAMTTGAMREIAESSGLEVLEQRTTLRDGRMKVYAWPSDSHPDAITVLRRPMRGGPGPD
ncbi:MAG TPA: class I SAM-dependent methyltransferase [Chthonomonadales bacterium]|nr:class I SAM-dependent methyltransferase [Chthonomonadales bacterium]